MTIAGDAGEQGRDGDGRRHRRRGRGREPGRGQHRGRGRTGRALGVLVLGVAAVGAFVAATQRSAVASESHVITIVSAEQAATADVDLTGGGTFADILDDLGASGERTIALDIPGLDAIAGVPMDLTTGPGQSLALTAGSFGSHLGAHVADVRPVLYAVWDDLDVPDLALAFAVADTALDELHGVWANTPGVDEAIELARGVITLVPDLPDPTSFDPAGLPDAVLELYEATTSDPALVFDEVATLLGDLDASEMPGLSLIAAFLGADVDALTREVNQVIAIGGSLAETAAFLFELLPADGEAISLRAPLDISTENLPLWVQAGADAVGIDVPELRIRLEPNDTGALVAIARFGGTLPVTFGGTTNVFDYAVDLDQAEPASRSLKVTAGTASFDAPFDLDWLDLENVELAIDYRDENPANHEFTGRFEADLPIGDPAPRLTIEIADDPDGTRGLVTVDGSVPVPDLLELLGRAPGADENDLVDLLGLGSASVGDIELTVDSDGPVFGLLGTVTDVTDVFEDLRVQLLLGIDGTGFDASTLVALLVDSDGCDDGECIRLDQVIPLPGGGLSVDVDLPAVRFLQIAPEGAEFPTGKLGDGAREFLAGFTDDEGENGGDEGEGDGIGIQSLSSVGEGDDETLARPGGLQLLVDVPLGGLAPLFDGLGITPRSDTVRVEGSAGFTLPDLTDGGSIDLTDLRLDARQDGFDSRPPVEGFPDWLKLPDVGQWSLFVEFVAGDATAGTADTVALGASVEGLEFDLLAGAEIRLDATFTGEPAGPTPTWSLTASAALADEWVAPFGVEWLTISAAEARLTISEAAGQTDVAASIGGTFVLGSPPNTVALEVLVELSTSRASISIGLAEDLTVAQVLAPFAAPELMDQLPDGLGAVALQAGSKLAVEVVFADPPQGSSGPARGIYVDVEVNVGFTLFGTDPIGISALIHASVPEGGDPFFMVGMRPSTELRLSDLVPIDFPDGQDLVLVSEDSSLAFLFSYAGVGEPGNRVDPLDLSAAARSWFAPLVVDGGRPEDRSLGTGVGVLGAVRIPDALGEFASELGVQDQVQLFGQIPLDGSLSLSAGLGLVADPDQLPDFLERASLSVGIGVELGAIQFSMNGTMVVRGQQGVDAELAENLGAFGVDLEVAAEITSEMIDAGHVCPRGGVLREVTVRDAEPDDNPAGRPGSFCFDLLQLSLDGSIDVDATGVSGTIGMAFDSLNHDGNRAYGWSPLGLDIIEINELAGEVTLGFTIATRAFSIEIGGQGSVTVLGYSVSGGIKGGIAVTPPPPPPPIVTPLFDGFWIALPQGIGTQELLDLYAAIVPDSDATAQLEQLLTDGLPDLALRDLFFSIGLADVPSLCINQGVALTAEMYVDPTGPPPEYAVRCDRQTGQLVRDGAPVGDCLDRRDEGCVARVDIELSLSEIRIEGQLAGFDVALTDDTPPVLRFENTIFVLRLNSDELLLRVDGGVQIGPGDPAWAEGSVHLLATPFQLDAAGRIQVLGYGALFELSGGLGGDGLQDLLTGGIDPGLDLRIVLTAPGGFGADPDFGSVAEAAVAPLLESIDEVGQFLDEWLGQFTSINQVGVAEVLIDLPLAANAELDIGLDPTVADTLEFVRTWVLPATGDGPTLDTFLNTDVSFGIVDWIRILATLDIEAFLDKLTGGGDDEVKLSACTVLRGLYEEFYGVAPATGDCRLAEVRTWIRALTRSAVDGVSHLAALTDAAIDQVLDIARSGVPFTIECAELNASLSLVGGSSFAAAVSGKVFGEPYTVGLDIDLDALDPFGDELLERAWALLTTNNPPSTSCTGINPALAGLLAAEAVPVVGVTAAPRLIDEGDTVEATVSFDRVLDADRTVAVDWGDPTSTEPPTEVTVAAGTQSATATHVYRDDVPSGRSRATYTIRVDDQGESGGETGGSASTTVTVRNVRPTITAIDTPARVDEGEAFDLTVRWTDPGILDTHDVSITWGDGSPAVSPTVVQLAVEEWDGGLPTWEATASHTYADDDPTGTPEDPYTIRVLVSDDDRGNRLAFHPITVVNVAPSAVTVTPLLVDDGHRIEEGLPVTYRIAWSDPGVHDTFDVVIDFCHEHPTCDEPVVELNDIEAQFVDVTHVYRDDDPTGTPVDDHTIAVTVTDDDTGVGTGTRTVAVHNVDPVVTLDVDALTTQYSDPFGGDPSTGLYEPVVATVEVYDVIPDTLEMAVTFDGGDGLVGWLELREDGCVVDAASEYHHRCTWSLIQRPDPVSGIYTDIAPGTYDLAFSVVDDDTGTGSATLAIEVLPEDARVWYVGPTFAATTSANDGSATVELRATIRDITSAVPDDHPDWDPWPGDIRNASMRFEDRESTSPTLCSTGTVDEVFVPFDVFDADRSIGVGSCNWTANINNKDADEFVIGTVVGAYYDRDDSTDDTLVTIAKPLDDFITGGGYLELTDSAGVFAGAAGSKANFGLHVKFNRRLTNLQGGVNLIVRGDDGSVYRIKSNAMSSLGIDTDGHAQFESKANLTDVTDKDHPIGIGGNYVLQMTMSDRSQDGSDDTIGFSLWDEQRTGNGNKATTTRLLLFSSRWNGNQTDEQHLAGGNLMVHYR